MMHLIAGLITLALPPLSPAAGAPSCAVPSALPSPHEEGPSARDPRRLMPIGGYTLSLIWSAENCRKGGSSGAGALDCRTKAGRNGFVLHGLWPDGQNGSWPQWCAPAAPLPAATLRAHYCATPSPQLAQHEWAKHGTCMPGYDADRYLATARDLFDAVRLPNVRALSYRAPTSAGLRRAVAAANPGMSADMVRLNLTRDGWLEEIWICLDRRMRRTSCAAPDTRADERVKIWRGGRGRTAPGAGL